MNKNNFPDEFSRLASYGLGTRSFNIRAQSFDDKTRSFEGIFATENPVRVFDWESMEPVDEVLTCDGMVYPERIPFLDNHKRDGIDSLLGSASDMRIENGQLIGRAYFGKSSQAEDAYIMARDGHISALSIGYIPNGIRVEKDAEYDHKGKKIKGPAKVSLRTEIKELSLTPIGADSLAKFRSAFQLQKDLNGGDYTSEIDDLKRKLDGANMALRMLSLTNKKGE